MEEMFLIDSYKWYHKSTPGLLEETKQALLREDRRELVLMPDSADDSRYLGILLEKYYTETLSGSATVRDTLQDGPFRCLVINASSIRGYILYIMRHARPGRCVTPASQPTVTFDDLFTEEPKPSPAQLFLQTNTPAKIEGVLNEYVIGQASLTRAVADFLYYHALRQLHPELPQRPLLISGPSGSGKTEVWRVAAKLYGDIFPIKVMDGSNLTCEGWAGNYKLDTYIDTRMTDGGILVVDEFDKLTKPRHSSSGDNVSLDIQAEFLKLMEGEYQLTDKRKQTNRTSKSMGVVLVGAFESLRAKKAKGQVRAVQPIGFCTQTVAQEVCQELTDEDFIEYGIMPEIVGRIATKCSSAPLTESVYLDILQAPHSRVTQLQKVLQTYGIAAADVLNPDQLRALVRSSQVNHTGVRWVCAQVENRLLEAIREEGLYRSRPAAS